ncbi:MAG: long-chain fatty acid--CoA ligase, partial [bacterium]|nr:long-chain fatty acid--CoA ligase [bacterium]
LVIENNNLLEAWIHLDYDNIDNETRGKSESSKYEFITHIMETVKADVNAQLPAFSKITKAFEQEEAFVKTATHKIKRYLYTHNNPF